MKKYRPLLEAIDTSQTQTPEFKKWFGKSKVVDKSGKPLVVYHGSESIFSTFDPKKIGTHTDDGMWGKGFYFSDFGTAKNYGKNIQMYYLRIINPFIINDYKTIQEMADYLDMSEDALISKDNLIRPINSQINQFTSHISYKKHDGVILKRDISSEYVCFTPNQIKSATDNNGDFDRNKNSIYEHNFY